MGRRLEPREDYGGNLVARHALFSVARRNVARPVADIFHAEPVLHSEKNRGMSVLTSAYLPRPEYFHKIAGARLVEIVEVVAKSELVKEAGCPRAVGIPATPNAFAIMLITNDELLESGEIEMQFSPRAQRLDGLDKHEIGRARAKTRIRRGWKNEKFA